ncbi:MAG TPA: molybdopterin-guanine dinucleotide biosynthesis protein MobB, partial [Sulfurospirillum sp. UBA11407]
TLLSQQPKEIDEIIKLLGEFDILLVEGLKTLPLPRISVFRNKLDESYFEVSNALAIDESIDLQDYTLPSHLEILDLNDAQMIVEWILKNAKKIDKEQC